VLLDMMLQSATPITCYPLPLHTSVVQGNVKFLKIKNPKCESYYWSYSVIKWS